MIAKVLGAGGGWSGKVEYLYEGKLEERLATEKKAEVILHSPNIRVPYDHTDKAGRQRMKADFIAQAQSHKWASKKDKTIGEHVLSFTPQDMRALGTKDGMRQVADEYVKLLGLDKTQYVAILHKDTDNPHLHIVFNRVTNDLKKYKDSHERRRALAAAVALSQKHGLSLVGGLKPAQEDYRTKTMRAGMDDLKELQAQRPLLSEARNMHHLGKIAEKQGLTLETQGDRIVLDQQKYKLSDLEAMFQANRNTAALARVAQKKESKASGAAVESEPNAAAAFEPHPLIRDATSMSGLEKTAAHRGIDIGIEAEHVSLDGKTYPLREVQALLADNERKETAYRIANGLPEKPNIGSTSAGPDSNLIKQPTADIVRLQSAMPKDPETEAYLAEYNVKSVALQTATDLAGLEKLCKQEGAFFAVGEYFTRVGDHSLRNDWVEEVMAANAQRQQSRPIQTTASVETHPQNPTEIAPLPVEQTGQAPLSIKTDRAGDLETETIRETTRVRMSDVQDMPYLNRTNHPGPEYDHRQAAAPEGGKKAQDRLLLDGQPERMVSMKTGYAREEKKPYRGSRRKGGKKTPDHELKIGKLKLSTDKSNRMKL